MIRNFVLNQTILPLLNKALDVYSLRQKAISSNIANVNTPGYRKKEVQFEEQLQQEMKKHLNGRRTEEQHFAIGAVRVNEVEPRILENNSPENASGVNNVDIDEEIVDQVKNQIRYMFVSRLAAANFSALRASIKGRFDR